jgi:hypothetical protein
MLKGIRSFLFLRGLTLTLQTRLNGTFCDFQLMSDFGQAEARTTPAQNSLVIDRLGPTFWRSVSAAWALHTISGLAQCWSIHEAVHNFFGFMALAIFTAVMKSTSINIGSVSLNRGSFGSR